MAVSTTSSSPDLRPVAPAWLGTALPVDRSAEPIFADLVREAEHAANAAAAGDAGSGTPKSSA